MTLRRRLPTLWLPLLASAGAVSLAVGGQATTGSAAPTVGFAPAVYVSTSLAGGEPFVIYSHGGKDLVYSSHEGTTHIDRNYLTTPGSACDIQTAQGFLCSYDNQVITWYSSDGGKTWTESLANPLATGFSDPSLTEDEGNVIYNTGIDLANDAVFASTDGGKTFVAGNPQCTPGDRPWLAGGKSGEVFMSTDPEGMDHYVVKGTVQYAGGQAVSITCTPPPAPGVSGPNAGITDGGAFTTPRDPAVKWFDGIGQMYYDHRTGDLIEPAFFLDGNPNSLTSVNSPNLRGVGISTLHDADAFSGSFTPSFAAANTDGYAHWPAIAIDQGDTVYVAWDTAPRDQSTTATNGCGATPGTLGGQTPLPNSIMLAYTHDGGKTWSTPVTVAHPGTMAIWPWLAAGPGGNVAVTWYQSNQVTDPDCDSASLLPNGQATQWTVQSAAYYGLGGASPVVQYANAVPVDASHPAMVVGGARTADGVMHTGGICQGGTTCAATGQDRRLGDYLTNALDGNGCQMIASGDTQLVDSITGGQFSNSRPIFLHQSSGPSLTTGADCSGAAGATAATTTPAPSASPSPGAVPPAVSTPNTTGYASRAAGAGLAVAGVALLVSTVVRRRRRRL
jgi:BNR/Asp-box repeat